LSRMRTILLRDP